ncbi:MAG: GntR family transcriptional regulator [Anaerolineae bacterium]|nr:GntR family transcriptional regulator [Anaerolineae bacterium]
MSTEFIIQVDTSSPIPLDHQIKESVREAIASERLRPDDLIPSDRELARQSGIHLLFIRQAIEELIKEGLLYEVESIGVFVARPKVVQCLPTVLGFSARMRQSGYLPRSQVLTQQPETVKPSVARQLRIAEEAKVMRLSRLRLADNEPLMIETSYLSLDRFPDLLQDDFTVRSLYEVIATRYGVCVHELDQTLEPVLITEYEADLLHTSPGAPAMLMEVIALDSGGVPIEFSKSIVRGDKCQYYFRMRSTQ